MPCGKHMPQDAVSTHSKNQD